MKGVAQPPEFHPEGDVFVHTCMLMERLKNPSPVLAFGALLHDVGKPKTYSKKTGRITFYNHAHIGAEMSRDILKRLRFSNREIEDILALESRPIPKSKKQVEKLIKDKEREMKEAAGQLEFELASILRDEIILLKSGGKKSVKKEIEYVRSRRK